MFELVKSLSIKVLVHKLSFQVVEEVDFWRSAGNVMNFGIEVKKPGQKLGS